MYIEGFAGWLSSFEVQMQKISTTKVNLEVVEQWEPWYSTTIELA